MMRNLIRVRDHEKGSESSQSAIYIAMTTFKSQGEDMTQTVSDKRVAIWFFAWLAGFAIMVWSLIIVFTCVPQADQMPPWFFLGWCALALVPFSIALSPWYAGIRCRNCRRRLSKRAETCDMKTGNTPLRFFCEDCDIIWESHLVSGPGDPNLP